MRFFVPEADSEEQAESAYAAIKDWLAEQLGAAFSGRRVQALRWVHDGERFEAEVGKETSFNGGLVVAILYEPDRELYHVCTPNRGVCRGMPILVGAHSMTGSVDFERE